MPLLYNTWLFKYFVFVQFFYVNLFTVVISVSFISHTCAFVEGDLKPRCVSGACEPNG
jgi:hypothetical protein